MKSVENWRKSLEVNVVFEVGGGILSSPTVCHSLEAVKAIVIVEVSEGCSEKHVEATTKRCQRLTTVKAGKGFKIQFLNTTFSPQKSREKGFFLPRTKKILCKKGWSLETSKQRRPLILFLTV